MGSTLLYSEILDKVHKAKEQRPESIYTETKRFRRFAYGNQILI